MTRSDAARHRRARAVVRRLSMVTAVGLFALLTTLAPGATAAAQSDQPTWTMPDGGNLFSAFSRTEYNEQDGAPTQVASPSDAGRQALQFSLAGGAQRTETRPRVPYQREGDVQYYAYDAYLAPGFPTDVSTWQLILQWHHAGDTGSPPIAVEVRDNRLMLASEGTELQDLGPISGGRPINLVLRIAFSRDTAEGTVDVWNSGRPVLRDYRPPGGTLIDESNYLKVGIYRDTAIDTPGRLYLEGLRAGPTMASVNQGGPAIEEQAPVTDPSTTASESTDDGATSTIVYVAGGVLLVLVLLLVARLRQGARR